MSRFSVFSGSISGGNWCQVDMATPSTCLNCGAPLVGGARQEFCPKCLFLQASAGLLGPALNLNVEDQESEVIGQNSAARRSRWRFDKRKSQIGSHKSVRRLRIAGGDRPRRHGRGLSRPATQPGSHGRHQDDGLRARLEPRLGQAVPRGGRLGGQPAPSEHRRHPRGRHP